MVMWYVSVHCVHCIDQFLEMDARGQAVRTRVVCTGMCHAVNGRRARNAFFFRAALFLTRDLDACCNDNV